MVATFEKYFPGFGSCAAGVGVFSYGVRHNLEMEKGEERGEEVEVGDLRGPGVARPVQADGP